MTSHQCHDPQCAAHGRTLRRLYRLQLALIRARIQLSENERRVRDERALGWDRAHTMLCHDTYPKCQHRNPWMKTRGAS